jgi:predicted metal-dependent peptidase
VAEDLRAFLHDFTHEGSFLDRYPYYAAVLAQVDPVADPSIELMAVSLGSASSHGRGPRYYLHVNVEQVAKQPQFLRGVLLHEVHHVVFGHLTHPKFFDVEHPDLMELAQEMSANEFIEELLPDPITWKQFEAWGVRSHQSTIERYRKLVATRASGKPVPHLRDLRFVDAHTWRPGEHGAPPPPGGIDETQRLLERAKESAPTPEVLQRAPKSGQLAGTTPGRLLEELVGAAAPPQQYVDWRTALRMFVARTRAPVHTWARPNRRFPDRLGEVPGRTYSPRVIVRPHLMVVIDTSMSMSARELHEIARHLAPMSEHARLTIAECDVEITKVAAFDGTLPAVKGRGGTDLRPPFERAFLRTHGVDGVVVFTDGQGPVPDAPPVVPTLWVLTKPLAFECPWGTRAKLDFSKPSA